MLEAWRDVLAELICKTAMPPVGGTMRAVLAVIAELPADRPAAKAETAGRRQLRPCR